MSKKTLELLVADEIENMYILINDIYENKNTEKYLNIEKILKNLLKRISHWESYENKLREMIENEGTNNDELIFTFLLIFIFIKLIIKM